MNLVTVMDEVATRLETITGLRVWAYPPDSITPPAGIVGLPDTFTFDETYGRGMDRMTLPLWIAVGKATSRTARSALLGYCAGSGASSVKAVLESGTYTAFHTLRVVGFELINASWGATEYLTAEFELDITGAGSA